MAINPPLAEDGSPLTAEQIAIDLKEPRTRYAKMEMADYKARKPVPNQVPPPLSLHTIRQLEPKEQLIYLFNNANVLTWDQLHEYTSPSVREDIETFFKLIENTAVLVQGVWVVKTDRSYKHRAGNIRNWLLMKIALANPEDDDEWYLSRQRVADHCGISVELAGSIMDPIVELVPKKRGLKLKYAPDYDFAAQYPEKVAKYNSFFTKIRAQVEKEVGRWIREEADETAATAKAEAAVQEKRSKHAALTSAVISQAQARARSEEGVKQEADFSASLDINEALESGPALIGVVVEISDIAKEQLNSLIKKSLELYGVISAAGLATMAAKSSECPDVESPLSEALAIQTLVDQALRIKNVFITPNGSDPTYEVWREIATDFAKEGHPFKRIELSAAFRQGKGKEPTRAVYAKIVSELFIVEADGSLKLKTGDASEGELRTR